MAHRLLVCVSMKTKFPQERQRLKALGEGAVIIVQVQKEAIGQWHSRPGVSLVVKGTGFRACL